MKKLTRREFLKGSAASAAGVAALGMMGGNVLAEEAPMEKMGEGYSWETPPDPIPDDEIVETIESDIVIVGAGIAGVTAALRASELGASVTVIEKNSFPSGRGGHYAAYQSRAMTEAGLINDDKDQIAADWMRFCGNRINQKLVYLFLDNSSKVMDWLDDMSGDQLNIIPIVTHYANPQYYEHIGTHVIRGSFEGNTYGMTAVVYFMWQKAMEFGAQFVFDSPAEQLVKEDGRVVAAIAKDVDGYKKYVGKKGVVLATGDISGNDEMMKAYCDPVGLKCKALVYTPVGCNTGDGQRMGMWVGGHMQDGDIPTMIHLVRYCGVCFGFLYVNAQGQRFMNEDTWIQSKSIQILNQAESKGNEFAYSIMDANWAKDAEASIPYGGGQFWDNMSRLVDSDWDSESTIAMVEKSVESGVSFKADTIEELAEQIGCDPEVFKATVDRYNEMYEQGYDSDFHKRAELLSAIKEPPFYAVKFGPALLCAPGGLEINEKLQVLDDDDEPIPGLYAIGNCSGGRYSIDYPVFINGNSHGTALTWGYTVAENIVNGE